MASSELSGGSPGSEVQGFRVAGEAPASPEAGSVWWQCHKGETKVKGRRGVVCLPPMRGSVGSVACPSVNCPPWCSGSSLCVIWTYRGWGLIKYSWGRGAGSICGWPRPAPALWGCQSQGQTRRRRCREAESCVRGPRPGVDKDEAPALECPLQPAAWVPGLPTGLCQRPAQPLPCSGCALYPGAHVLQAGTHGGNLRGGGTLGVLSSGGAGGFLGDPS